MGLSASQAKLLSITSRLSDNELRSQTITNAKMALATRSAEASRNYVNALNATEFTYKTYDADGAKVYVPMTGAQLSKYGPLKNQYALVNNAGQVLLSEFDATNYEASANITDFLKFYGIDWVDTGKTKTVTNPAYLAAYNQYMQDYNDWLSQKPDPTLDIYQTSGIETELYQKFHQASSACFWAATVGSRELCYLHVLAHMLDLEVEQNASGDWKAKTSSYPKTFLTTPIYHAGGGGSMGHFPSFYGTEQISIDTQMIDNTNINSSNHGICTHDMVEVSDAIANGYNGRTIYAAKHPEQEASLTLSSSNAEILLNNYQIDRTTGNKSLKTLKQKCIDLYYAVENRVALGIDYETVLIPAIRTFQEDLTFAFTDFNDTLYQQDYAAWLAQEPAPITIPPTLEEPVYEYSDKDKAQWYVNLWHRINGEQDAKDGTQTVTNTVYGEFSEYGFPSTTTTSTSTRFRYDILEDGLMNSQQWLKYALETGAVYIERVEYADQTELHSGLQDVEWNAVVYTSILEFNEQTSEKAIAIAEAEYQQKQREIENKDKQYDSMIKLLDTEHSALQAELESVQKIIPKNIERTLKIYT